MSKIKILICTHSAALHSGLSETTRHIFIPLLQKYKDKYDIHQLGYFHHTQVENVPWPIYSTMSTNTPQGLQYDEGDRYGQKSFDKLVSELKPDIVFGYGDMWHFDHMLASPFRNNFRLITYYTIDGQPYFGHLGPNGETDWGTKLLKADEIVVLSHFGKETLKQGNKELKDKDIKVMYHPLDMSRYPILDAKQKFELRDKLLPKHLSRDCFIVGWVGKNQFRKQNYKLWEIMHYVIYGDYIMCKDCDRVSIKEYNHTARSSKDPNIPGELNKITMYDRDYDYSYCWHCKSKNITQGTPRPNCYIWFHMDKNEPGYNAEFHERMWKIENNCLYTKEAKGSLVGISARDLALLLTSWDCMLYPSGGEGFGNPPAEAMAAGTPIVFSDYSSHAEFCQFGGLPIRCMYQPEIATNIMRAIVDTSDAVRQIIKLMDNPNLKAALGNRGKNYISQYDISQMVTGWDNIFSDVYNRPLPHKSGKIYSTIV